MPDDPLSRRLTTIVALDVTGYSARTEAHEARTTAEVAALRRVIEGIATAQGGHVFNTAGDGFTLEFGSSLAAVEAAFALADKCDPKVRVGVHLGDVVVQPNGDLLGHGVNVAPNLDRCAPSGGPQSGELFGAERRPPSAPLTLARSTLWREDSTLTGSGDAGAPAWSTVLWRPDTVRRRHPHRWRRVSARARVRRATGAHGWRPCRRS
jgi:hypothetical protein